MINQTETIAFTLTWLPLVAHEEQTFAISNESFLPFGLLEKHTN